MSLDPAEFVEQWYLFAPQLYDYQEIAFMRRKLRPGDTFVDVGAHIGFYTFAAASLVGPTGTVVAVEADPQNFARLRETGRRNRIGNVRFLNVGVSDRRERLVLRLNETGNRGGHSFLYGEGRRGVEIECEPLLELLLKEETGWIRGAKLDIEGFEHKVLSAFFRNAEEWMFPEFLIIEFYEDRASIAGNSVQLAERNGYVVQARHGYNVILVRQTHDP
jgi:FkbM family methyltransferase